MSIANIFIGTYHMVKKVLEFPVDVIEKQKQGIAKDATPCVMLIATNRCI